MDGRVTIIIDIKDGQLDDAGVQELERLGAAYENTVGVIRRITLEDFRTPDHAIYNFIN